jgi:hypothetical protein
MDFLGSAFGEFEPDQDPFAAAKFALASIFLDDRIEALQSLITSNHRIGAVSGEPGWIIERKDDGQTHEGFAVWPAWARFRAYVDPRLVRAWPSGMLHGRRGISWLRSISSFCVRCVQAGQETRH